MIYAWLVTASWSTVRSAVFYRRLGADNIVSAPSMNTRDCD